MNTNSLSRHQFDGEIQKIADLHGQVIGSCRLALENALQVGALLVEVREKLPHGQWESWIFETLPFSNRTARRYLALHENRDRLKTATVSDLSTAYRLLATPDTTEVEAAEKRIAVGWSQFRAVADALAKIRNERLWREEHATFASYAAARWGFDADLLRLLGMEE